MTSVGRSCRRDNVVWSNGFVVLCVDRGVSGVGTKGTWGDVLGGALTERSCG